ncbi:MAG: hypothetical protein JNK63_06630 [Chthonomonas sp.]|nr:hypothetical protein [Chthonomonas sp.]
MICLLLPLVIAGCSSPEQPVVYVNLDQLAVSLMDEAPAVPGVQQPTIAAVGTVRGSSSKRLFSALTQKELEESAAQIKSNRQDAIRRIMTQRLKVLDAEIESALAASRARLAPEHARLLDDAAAQTRIPFDKLAPRAGELTLELTNLMGFPDLGHPYRTVAAKWSEDRAKRVEAIRGELEQLNATYLEERTAILDQAYRRIARDDETLRNNANVARKEGEERLIKALAQLSEGGSDPMASMEPLQGARLELPSTPNASVRVNSSREALTSLPRQRPVFSPRWTAEQKAGIWAGSQGYRLVLNRNQGRDATKECILWIQKQKAGL